MLGEEGARPGATVCGGAEVLKEAGAGRVGDLVRAGPGLDLPVGEAA